MRRGSAGLNALFALGDELLIQARGGRVIAKSFAEDNRQAQPNVEHERMTGAERLLGTRQCAFVIPASSDEVGCLRIEDGDLEQRSDRLDVRGAGPRFSNGQRPLEHSFRAGVVPQRHQHAGEASQRGRDRQVVWTEGLLPNSQGTLEQRFSAGRVSGEGALDRQIDQTRRQEGMRGLEHPFFDGDRALGQLSFLLVRHLRRAAYGAAQEIENLGHFHGISAAEFFNSRQYRARDFLALNAASAIEEIHDRGQRLSESRQRCRLVGDLTSRRGSGKDQDEDEDEKPVTIHQSTLTPNWISRAGRVLVTLPNDDPHVVVPTQDVFTSRNCVWLNALMTSALNCRRLLPGRPTTREMATSHW